VTSFAFGARERWSRLGMAAALSGVAHAAVVALGHIELPTVDDPLPLAARIAIAPTSALPVARPPAAVAAPRTGVAQSGVRVATADRVTSPLPAAASEEIEAVAEETPAVEDTAASAPPEPVVIAKAEPTLSPSEPPLRSLPRKGRITYNLVYGRDQFPVGRTVQTWEMGGGRYQLASRSETTGIVDMIRSQHRTYSSSGSLTREGLRPESFRSSRNRGRGSEEASAQFDWTKSTVVLGRTTQTREENLPVRSQDLLSFVYQLSLDPPAPGRLRQVVTNGSRIEVYELDVLREETIETPLGMLRALPLKQVRRANEESIELWLAVEYQYLPVKLRFLDRAGEAQGEQIVAEIRLSEN
jgi:hypothetical protein